MGVIWYKIWHDLWENRGRTVRVVLIIAVGAFAVGAVIGSKEFISQDLSRTWQASTPATIGLEVEPTVDEGMIETLRHLSGVGKVTGWFQMTIRYRRTPTAPWQSTLLVALDDYNEQEIRKVFKDNGDWPRRKLLGVQRGRGFTPGDTTELEINDKVYQATINGILYNTALPPIFSSPDPMFFTTRQHFTELTGETNYSLILATVPNYSTERATAVADLMQAELEKVNIEVSPALFAPGGFKRRVVHPDRFVAQDVIDGVFAILSIMATLSLILGLFLVYNTVNAIIVQQVNQIGVMKAIGARFSQILVIYIIMVLVYGLLALMLAIPLSAVAAHALRLFMIGNRIGMTPGPFQLSIYAALAQTGIALISPLLSAIMPIFSGASVTVREAVSSYGLSAEANLLDRLIAHFDALPRIIGLTVGNTFRNKKRVLLTEISLVGAGLIFMMVMNTYHSMMYTFSDVIFSIFQNQVMLDLKQAERIEELEQLTLTQPEVKAVEIWGTAQGTARRASRAEANDDNKVNLRGVPLPSQIYVPQLQAGRWLQVADSYAVVLNEALAQSMGVKVGDWITIKIPAKRDSQWQVVGLVFEPLDQTAALMPRDTLLKEIRQVGRGKSIKVQTWHNDALTEANTAAALRSMYEAKNYEVIATTTDTAHRTVDQRVRQMSLILALLTIMAVMVAIVGAIALSGTLAINVLERIREIGIMRAIGASSAAISGQFVGEGLILGWISWLVAIPLSIPTGQWLVDYLSILLNIKLVYRFSTQGVFYWLVIITVLAIIASWFPAQKAAQTSVRDSLSYA
jgi:putative ABC transport system permease protein